jgi:hypothetical protein
MYVCVYSVFVLFCVQVATLRRSTERERKIKKEEVGRTWDVGRTRNIHRNSMIKPKLIKIKQYSETIVSKWFLKECY